MYTMAGGLKATFLASYMNTAVIFIGLVVFITFVFSVQGNCDELQEGDDTQCNYIGSAAELRATHPPIFAADPPRPRRRSAARMYERLQFNINLPEPTADQLAGGFHQGSAGQNRGGSYLTMISQDGLMFGIINTVGNFGTVFVDQAYWQSAIAASPGAAHKGYLLGGLCWFVIPFGLATALGLAATALNANLTVNEANSGLVPTAAATILMGTGGSILMIVMLFMAIISTGSAEAIAVSSLVTYDIYRKYINPAATGADILRISRYVILAFGLFSGGFACILNQFGISLGWVYNFMGVMIGSAVVPVAYLVLWKDAAAAAVISGAWMGMIAGLVAWIGQAASVRCATRATPPFLSSLLLRDPLLLSVTSLLSSLLQDNDGAVNKDTLGTLNAQLAGCITSILVSGFIATIGSWLKPQNFDWDVMRNEIKNFKTS